MFFVVFSSAWRVVLMSIVRGRGVSSVLLVIPCMFAPPPVTRSFPVRVFGSKAWTMPAVAVTVTVTVAVAVASRVPTEYGELHQRLQTSRIHIDKVQKDVLVYPRQN
jgi:hypothetical protein